MEKKVYKSFFPDVLREFPVIYKPENFLRGRTLAWDSCVCRLPGLQPPGHVEVLVFVNMHRSQKITQYFIGP